MSINIARRLGVLDLAAERCLIDFAEAIRTLERAGFRRPAKILDELLAKHEARRSKP